MLDRTVAEKYYEYALELDKFYKESDIKLLDVVGNGSKESLKKQVLEYFFPWRTLEEGQEVDQLYFKFNHSPNELFKYIGVIDRLGDILYSISSMELKKYHTVLIGNELDEYKSNKNLSDDTKLFAEIYFKFKSLENDLVKWLKKLEMKINYESNFKKADMYI